MSDRIGVMRQGRLVQVGTPHEIYVRPIDKFVSEFMGEVNVIDVRAGSNGKIVSDSPAGEFTPPQQRSDFAAGHLVVRPEFMRFLRQPAEAENHLRGRLYNEYALGSRIQYQVRVGDHVFIVEKLRQQAFDGKLDDEVLIGWDARDSVLVER